MAGSITNAWNLIVWGVFASTISAGCTDAGREIGEDKLNRSVGHSVAGTYFETNPHIKRLEQGEIYRYLQRGKSGCDIDVIVDKKTKRIISWEYVSSPDLCWRSGGP